LNVNNIMAAKSGDMVTVDYVGKLEDGKEFDSTKGKDPLQFMIGAGQFLKGFEEGIIGMEQGYDKGELAHKVLKFKVTLQKIGF
jgi:peptidylprolyl isomerase